MECLSKLQANVITEKGTRLSLFKPNHVWSVCQPVSRLLVKRILLVKETTHMFDYIKAHPAYSDKEVI